MDKLNQQAPVPQAPEKSHGSKIMLFIFGAVAILIGVGGYVLLGINKSQTPLVNDVFLQPSPAPIDSTANWKTYASANFGYSLKYPLNLIYSTRIDKAVGQGKVNVDQWSTRDETYTISVHSYEDGVEPITKILVSTKQEEKTTLVAGQTVKKMVAESQPLIHVGPIKNKGLSYLIVFVAPSSSKTSKSDIKIFNQILSTFKFTQ